MSEKLTKETFARFLHTKFRLHYPPEQSVEIELVEMSDDNLPGVEGQERFSLIFHIPAEQLLPQATYRMEHEEMGSFDIFIVPVGRAEPGFRYQAVFNRMMS